MTSSLFEMKLTVREFIDIDNDSSNFENVSLHSNLSDNDATTDDSRD